MGSSSLEFAGVHDELVGLIYEAAVDTDRWLEVARCLSAALDGRSITIWLKLPSANGQSEFYRHPSVDLPPDVFAKYWQRGLPWGSQVTEVGPEGETTKRFVAFESVFPNDKLAATDYYKEWMAPQGLAPASPIVHVFSLDGQVPTAAICVFQRVDSRPLEPAHFEFLDRLVSHLARAHCILDQMRAMRREHDVLREVIDRIPTGIVLVDETGHVATLNDSALLSIENQEGMRIEEGRLVLDDPDSNRWLARVVDEASCPQLRAGGFRERPMNGNRSTTNGRVPVVVTPLLSPASRSTRPDTVAMIFVGSPKLAQVTSMHLLRNLYGLTRAEAEITQLIADGLSLEEAAERRTVTLNTARSQLKRVFSKTGAKRQADLVRIVIGGVASMRGERLAG
jgi:DNA-binding CsgD family transcriptional regulator/PAS domain-containing protein